MFKLLLKKKRDIMDNTGQCKFHTKVINHNAQNKNTAHIALNSLWIISLHFRITVILEFEQ